MGVKTGQRVLVNSPDHCISGTVCGRIIRYGVRYVQVKEQYSHMRVTVPAGFVQRDTSRKGRQS
jgi:hypothetical protein